MLSENKKLGFIFNVPENSIKLSLTDFINNVKNIKIVNIFDYNNYYNPKLLNYTTHYFSNIKNVCYVVSSMGLTIEKKIGNKK